MDRAMCMYVCMCRGEKVYMGEKETRTHGDVLPAARSGRTDDYRVYRKLKGCLRRCLGTAPRGRFSRRGGTASTYGVLRAFGRGHPHGKMVLADSRCSPRIIGSTGFL